jgi:amino acid adenylation domain-containing protein
MTEVNHPGAIAIVGMSGRFPGARNLEEYWENLRLGRESISFFTDKELIEVGVDPELLRDPATVKARGILDDVSLFDAAFFGINPREAQIMDPQQRLFLECAHEALEHAGYGADNGRRRIGIFAGTGVNTYLLNNLLSNEEELAHVGSTQFRTANRPDNLTTRVSYKLNLRGPSVTVQTNCSTSLVAIHMGCQSLLLGECEIALAGAAAISIPQKMIQIYQEGGIASEDGHCRAFDAKATGMVPGNGIGIVVLRRLSDAIASRDHIHAVILGSAVNNDGAMKVGYTAPSVDGQCEVITEAIAVAGITPDSIGYVEAHGTGTPLGDPVEVTALTDAFRKSTDKLHYCALGSVKTNIGHLDTAAGVAGLIKAVLALRHKQIPPSLHYGQPNPQINFAETPFFICDKLREWMPDEGPRRAGVSSFGIGGTNAHIILEEAVPQPVAVNPRSLQLLVVSARTSAALDCASKALGEFLRSKPDMSLQDTAYTMAIGRSAFAHRKAIVAGTGAQAADHLASISGASCSPAAGVRFAFMFGGQGTQYANMGRELYDSEPLFRDVIDQAAETLTSVLGKDIRSVLFPEEAASSEPVALDQTLFTQPVLFVFQYALAQLFMEWGIRPTALAGHSIGEYVAACISGVFSLESALQIVGMRARLISSLPQGAMLSVPLSPAELRSIIPGNASLAAVNGPVRCVVSGEIPVIQQFERELSARHITCKRVHVSHAFHSEMMTPVLESFREVLSSHQLHVPSIPFVSNLTGTWIQESEARNPDYWVRHLRGTVQFDANLTALANEKELVFLDLGATPTLNRLARAHPHARGNRSIAVMPESPAKSSLASLLSAIGEVWVMAGDVAWEKFYRGRNPSRLPLPTYPFERQSYWIDAVMDKQKAMPKSRAVAVGAASTPDTLAELKEVAPKHIEIEVAHDQIPANAKAAAAIDAKVDQLIFDLSGQRLDEVTRHKSFLDLGFDSLQLMQLSQLVQRRFGVTIGFRQFFEEFTTVAQLVTHLQSVVQAEAPAEKSAPMARLELLAREIEKLRAEMSGSSSNPSQPLARGDGADANRKDSIPPENFGPWRPVRASGAVTLNDIQKRHVAELAAEFNSRTAKSKAFAQQHRRHLADARAAAGFRVDWKEMVYPIVAKRSLGAKIWDIDGNEYIDLVMGFGVNLLGHNPPFVTEAIQTQLKRGLHIGVQSALAGESAQLICELTGAERVLFCNTGSEAVMSALRISRTVTGRQKVVMFAGSYHGISDGVLARRRNSGPDTVCVPVAPGIPAGMVDEVWVLDYADQSALDFLRENIEEIAAVLVEPVQSSRPGLQPREFLEQLRQITTTGGAVLIFDEMISGFRIHPGGCQAWFDVKADVALYGKIIGGGLPIGVIAGNATCLDAVDGGDWSYGDNSYPRANQTFMAGTFSKHPLTVAAAHAVLQYLKSQGPDLQTKLNERTAQLVATLNTDFKSSGVPLQATRFASLFRLEPLEPLPLASLFYFHLLSQSVHLWEGRTCFLSTAHEDLHLEKIAQVIRQAVHKLQDAECLPRRQPPKLTNEQPPGPAPKSEEIAFAFPLTDAQKALWASCQRQDDSVAYNEFFSAEIKGELDIASLQKAINSVVRRHDSLRTSFSVLGDHQYVHREIEADIEFIDFSSAEEQVAAGTAADYLRKQAAIPFKLEKPSLARFRVVRINQSWHIFSMIFHHLIGDNWSLGLLLREILLLYGDARSGTATCVAPPIPFKRYADHLDRLKLDVDGRAFWAGQLRQPLPKIDFSQTKTRVGEAPTAVERHRCEFGVGLSRELKTSASAQNATLFMVLLAAFQVLAHRLFQTDEMLIGVPVAGQPAMGEGSLIGYCLQVLPIRSRYESRLSWSEFLGQMKLVLLQAQKYQSYPVASLLLEARGPGVDHHTPVFPVLFNFDGPPAAMQVPGLQVRAQAHLAVAPKTDLAINIAESPNGLGLDLDFRAALWDRETIERWADSFISLLRAVIANPASRLAELPVVSEQERCRLLQEWNATATEYPETSLQELFEEQVARTPDACALEYEGQRISYAELDCRANQLSSYLRQCGIGPETRVAVFMERSFEMVIGLLGILKAGAAYVPVDPEYPVERIGYILDDAAPSAILTLERLKQRLPASAAPVVSLDNEWSQIAVGAPVKAAFGYTPDPDTAIYVIYTSGSTGRPKGVINTQRGVVNRLIWMQRAYHLTPDSRVLQKTPFAFDVSVWEFFWPLITGARLVIARPGGHRDPEYLIEVIQSNGITLLHFVPSMLRAFLSMNGMRRCPGVRQVFASGEALTTELEREFFAQSSAELHNLYGPTEAAIDVTFWSCSLQDQTTTAPLGKPISNMRVYVLDHDHQPVPIGIPGELYLGGVGLARGYWNNPVLTAKSFIPDPFARAGGERLYRTGDVARWLSNGVLEFLGRADHQVKIRGYRVELGEIEATIESHSSVSEAAVAVKHSSQNEIQLTAYVVAKNRAALIPEDIRQWLAERLPAPMIPARIAFLDHLPLNQNGKIDRHALASMQVESLAPRRPIVGRPLDPTEERIAAIWREILQIKDIAPQDSFFEIGGHSLNAIQMLSRLRDSFGIEVPLRELFDEPTLASLAVRANKLAAGPAAKRTPIIRRARPTRSTGEVLSESNVTPAAETPNLRS